MMVKWSFHVSEAVYPRGQVLEAMAGKGYHVHEDLLLYLLEASGWPVGNRMLD